MKKILLILVLGCGGCVSGPNYTRPLIAVPNTYKEAAKDWKLATPQDESQKGEWWKIFHDPQLNVLQSKLDSSNQNIAVAQAQYQQAQALIGTVRANYFPLVTGLASSTRQQSSSNTINSSTNNIDTSSRSTINSINLEVAWEPDLWGSVKRAVEAKTATAKANAAQLAAVRLSMQALLAQYYFELRAFDRNHELLTVKVKAYQKLLEVVKNRYRSGIASKLDVIQIESQLEAAKISSFDAHIERAQYEHAIAVLIGEAPANFSLPPYSKIRAPHQIPLQLPSSLLERRPDVAQAERLMEEANAEIGIYTAAFFPVLDLTGLGKLQSNNFNHWLSHPATFWSVGPQLTAVLFDAGSQKAQLKAARANYDASVASYRQIVLTAFQEVEDNLVAIRLLKSEAMMQDKIVANAKQSEQILINQYKAGIVSLSEVLNAQISDYDAELNSVDITRRQILATIGLIKALGGDWKKTQS